MYSLQKWITVTHFILYFLLPEQGRSCRWFLKKDVNNLSKVLINKHITMIEDRLTYKIDQSYKIDDETKKILTEINFIHLAQKIYKLNLYQLYRDADREKILTCVRHLYNCFIKQSKAPKDNQEKFNLLFDSTYLLVLFESSYPLDIKPFADKLTLNLLNIDDNAKIKSISKVLGFMNIDILMEIFKKSSERVVLKLIKLDTRQIEEITKDFYDQWNDIKIRARYTEKMEKVEGLTKGFDGSKAFQELANQKEKLIDEMINLPISNELNLNSLNLAVAHAKAHVLK